MNGVCNAAHTQGLYNWKDVTNVFMESCGQLEMGELLHDDMFGLFEAMSAIEMMDPKMDAGMICNRSSVVPLTFKEAVDTGHLPLVNPTPGQQIGIIDETLSCLVTWLEGHSLAQTVFTNLYLHHTDKIEDTTLKAFSIAVLKLVDIIKDFIAKGNVFEEEDFQPLTYGFKLGSEVNEQRAVSMLREAEDELQKKCRNTRAREGEVRDEETALLHEQTAALFSRIRLIRLLYSGLVSLFKLDVADGGKLLSSSQDQMPTIIATIRLGGEAKEGRPMTGFEPLVNQRLLPPTFPRYTEIKDRPTGLRYLQALVDRLLTVTSVVHIQSFHSALDFFQDFSASSPCVLSRSVLQLMYAPLQASYNILSRPVSPAAAHGQPPMFQELLKDSCRVFISPPALLLAPRISPGQSPSPIHTLQVKQCIDTFFSQCCRPFGLLLQSCGHNRARQRDKISVLLEEFSTVQEEADKIDNMLNTLAMQAEGGSGRPHSLLLGTWLLYHVLRLMIRYVLSGFELELYSRHEYPYVFWYLYELLYPWLINCLHRADTYLSEHNDETKKSKSKKKAKSSTKKSARSRPYVTEIACYQAHTSMCAGLYKLLVAAKKEEKILVPSAQFDNEAVRYEHRFGAFANLLTPPLMPYSQYKEVSDHTEKASIKTLYNAASRDFSQARQILETVQVTVSDEEIINLITVNKTNFVVASVLARDSNREIDFDFSLHQNFPTIKLV